MEIWDLYDNDGQKLNNTVIRGESIDEGAYHLVVHIIIKNSDDLFLIQKRSDTKDLFPGIWAFTGGSATIGEDSRTAALRELHEETGIELGFNDLKMVDRMFYDNNMADIWYGEVDVDVTTLKFQVEEVSALAFETKEKIKEMISTGLFHKYRDKYLETVFNIGGEYVR